MIDLTKLSRRCRVRVLRDADADAILALCRANTQYYAYCGRQTSREEILRDLHITPPGKTLADKYYVGFFDGDILVAVMDLIDGYPDADTAFIGFFMLARERQGRGLGSAMIAEALAYLTALGYSAVRLCIDEGNPQSTAFWTRNGFHVLKRIPREKGCVLLAERPLSA
jgi:RimJ/RimL family protein N-acetyltransferase